MGRTREQNLFRELGKMTRQLLEQHRARLVEAGLGALMLPRADLPGHFDRWPAPPVDGRFQGYWLRGQRRLRHGAGDIEALAQLPGLKDGHRLDLWRRASEKRVLSNECAQPSIGERNEGLLQILAGDWLAR